jgi:5-methylcytosine-specific restriction endonuclease McrA
MKNSKKSLVRHRGGWQGMNWIRQDKRLAIYLRDGLACVYCGAAVEGGAQFTLDHVRSHTRGGSTDATNLATACLTCNASKNSRTLAQFAKAVAVYINHSLTAAQVVAHVRACTSRALGEYRTEAKKLIARRGSASRVLDYLAQ